jgi:hypothetical protein
MSEKKYLKESIKLGEKELTVETGKRTGQSSSGMATRCYWSLP